MKEQLLLRKKKTFIKWIFCHKYNYRFHVIKQNFLIKKNSRIR